MRIRYGGFYFPDNGAHWLFNERALLENGIRYAKEITITVMGQLLGGSIAEISAQINAMRNACAGIGYDLALLGNNNELIDLITSVNAKIPMQVIVGPSFMGTRPAEFCTHRDFAVVFQGVYPAGNTGLILLELNNSVEIQGGGPYISWLPASNGPSQKQSPQPSVPQTCIQSGTAVSRNLPYPAPRALIRPKAYEQWQSGTALSDRITPTGIEYTRSWKYVYRDTVPF